MSETLERAGLIALLAWYRDQGVDAVLEDTPIDWLQRGDAAPGARFRADHAASPTPSPPSRDASPQPSRTSGPQAERRPASTSPAPRQFPTVAPDAATMAARQAAASAPALEALRKALETFDGCGLKATAKNLCFFRGSPNARLMIIGEAPGRDEDLAGKPFVGRAGQLLDKMLAAIGMSEDDVHITNIVYWRPPGNRTPTPQEAQVCRPFLERQIELVAPRIIMTLGGPATTGVLDVTGGILKARGRWRELKSGARAIPAMPSLHPAYLLRTPVAKRLAWRDLLAVKAALDAEPSR